ncbi:MAG: biotin transporter BioY [Deltaproteobacteria bacterium]|nr:biotin transporter BioY [Deltaproteobacteria bacterium]
MTESPAMAMHRLVWTGLGAAAIAAGTFVQFHLGPVPMTLQTMFVLLVGFVLGPGGGAAAVGLYLLAGVIGLPVFSGAGAGPGHLFGPTGGFLFGFAVGAAVAGLARRGQERPGLFRLVLFGFLGLAAIYSFGVPWLKFTLSIGWTRALQVGLLPFLPGAAIKLTLAVAAARMLFRRNLTPQ